MVRRTLDQLPALSVKQPWAWAIVAGVKPVENRTWPTSYRGLLLIHAGRRIDRQGIVILEDQHRVRLPEEFTIGAIVGQARLIDVVRNSRSRYALPGHYHFLLREARMFAEPIPCRGQLGLFWPDL